MNNDHASETPACTCEEEWYKTESCPGCDAITASAGQPAAASYTAEEQAVFQHCQERQEQGREIDHVHARTIAAWWSEGNGAYSSVRALFNRSGAISPGFMLQDIHGGAYGSQTPEHRLALDMLGTYVLARIKSGDCGPVDGWAAE